jgi:hypothetical protein
MPLTAPLAMAVMTLFRVARSVVAMTPLVGVTDAVVCNAP